jgi:hypothetical protein
LDSIKLDSGVRRNDARYPLAIGERQSTATTAVMPAKAGIQLWTQTSGIPAFAGMTHVTHWPLVKDRAPPPNAVMPAKAGIQLWTQTSGIPAFAGMTDGSGSDQVRA